MKIAATTLSLAAVLPVSSALATLPSAHQLAHRASTSQCTPVTPQPAGCNQKGTLSRFDIQHFIITRQILDLATCVQFCANRNMAVGGTFPPSNQPCTSISRDSASGICTFYDVTVEDLAPMPDSKSTTSFYNINSCFTCLENDCAVSPNANLFDNPNFGLSKSFIGPWIPHGKLQTDYQLVPNPIGQGNAIRFTFSGDDGTVAGVGVTQYRDICARRTYRASIAYKIDQLDDTPPGTDQSKMVLLLLSSMGDCSASRGFTIDDKKFGNWHSMECSLDSSNPAAFRFHLRGTPETPGNMKWNFTIANPRLASIGALKTKGPNLVPNGGFESGALAPWTGSSDAKTYGFLGTISYEDDLVCKPGTPKFSIVSPGFATKGIAPASNFKLRFCAVAPGYYGLNNSFDAFSIVQTIPVTKMDKSYVLSAQFRGLNATGLSFFLGDLDTDFATDSSIPQQSNDPKSNTTHVLSRSFTGIGLPRNLSIQFSGFRSEGPPVRLLAFVDNISIHELDE